MLLQILSRVEATGVTASMLLLLRLVLGMRILTVVLQVWILIALATTSVISSICKALAVIVALCIVALVLLLVLVLMRLLLLIVGVLVLVLLISGRLLSIVACIIKGLLLLCR